MHSNTYFEVILSVFEYIPQKLQLLEYFSNIHISDKYSDFWLSIHRSEYTARHITQSIARSLALKISTNTNMSGVFVWQVLTKVTKYCNFAARHIGTYSYRLKVLDEYMLHYIINRYRIACLWCQIPDCIEGIRRYKMWVERGINIIWKKNPINRRADCFEQYIYIWYMYHIYGTQSDVGNREG